MAFIVETRMTGTVNPASSAFSKFGERLEIGELILASRKIFF